jgi:arginase
MTQKKVALLGTPVEKGAGKLGCSMGSVALRIAGIEQVLKDLELEFADYGDIHFTEEQDIHLEGNAKFAPYITGWTRALEQKSYELLKSGATPLFMGGDHSLSMGSVSGAARYAAEQGKELHVLWVDAHTDFNTPLTSPSGNMHGMPVAFFCGEEGFDGILPADRPLVNPNNVYMVGIRSVDADEKALIASKGVNIYDMRSIDERRIVPVMNDIIERVKAHNAMLHVSFDADAVDPIYAPGVGTPVNGGLTYREAHLILEMLHDSELVTSFDVVELNPYLDMAGKTAHLLVDLVGSLFGKKTI